MNGKEFYELYQARWNELHPSRDERISKTTAEDACRTMLDLLDEYLDDMQVGERITFYGFGTFTKKRKPAHYIGDLKTGGKIEVPAKDRVSFIRSSKR